MTSIVRSGLVASLFVVAAAGPVGADESLLNYVKGAEVQPRGTWQLYQWLTRRSDKGSGHYVAHDYQTELEYGVTDRFAAAVYLLGQGIDTSGILVDAYIPKDEQYAFKLSGFAASLKYNFLSPIKDPVGLALYVEPIAGTLDPHSGQSKRTYSLETALLVQKNLREDTLILMANFALESTYARRAAVADLPPDFEWPVIPEMEIEPTFGAGVSLRAASHWYVGAELMYQAEYETEVGQERWSLFAGPTLHFAARRWWATLTWFPQLQGGGETVPGQDDPDLHLVEKTKTEWRLKVGINF